jgi:hypothetical protein
VEHFVKRKLAGETEIYTEITYTSAIVVVVVVGGGGGGGAVLSP